LATFGRICVITDKPFYGEGLINYSYIFPGKWYPGTGTRSCGTSLRWSRDQFFRDIDKEDAYLLIDKGAEKIQAGSQGLIFHPYLQGEGSPYDDPLLRGDFIGLTLHHTRDHMARSIMEGVSFSLLDSIEYIKGKGINIKPPLRCIGGGSKSRLWTKILTDVLGHDVIIPTITDPSVGAALIAGVGKGIFKDYEEAQEYNYGISDEISYDKNENLKYRDIFSIYKKAKKKLESINHQLATSYEI
jgi:xylulokinase